MGVTFDYAHMFIAYNCTGMWLNSLCLVDIAMMHVVIDQRLCTSVYLVYLYSNAIAFRYQAHSY